MAKTKMRFVPDAALVPSYTKDQYHPSVLGEATAWEIANSGDSAIMGAKPQYKYDSIDKAPAHHRNIARLFVAGRTPEQIAMLYSNMGREALGRVRTILRHPPVAQHIARELERVREEKEAVLAVRGEAAKDSFSVLVELRDDVGASDKVRLDAAKWLIEHDPLERYTTSAQSGAKEVMHSDALNEFFEKHDEIFANAPIEVRGTPVDTEQET